MRTDSHTSEGLRISGFLGVNNPCRIFEANMKYFMMKNLMK